MTLVAIDGPGGSGKSTVARALAGRLGLKRLDTGAMYRAVTLLVLRSGVDPSDAAAVAQLAVRLTLEMGDDGCVVADGEDVTEAIRSAAVDAAVSEVASHAAVREHLVERQRAWAREHGGGVVEGRDIASVVLPDADLKVFLTASPEVRAGRRAAQLLASAAERQELDEVAASIGRRDALDSGRAVSPLAVAPGAVTVDSTDRSIEDVVGELLALLEDRRRTPGEPPAPSPGPVPGAGRGLVAGRPIRAGELAFYAACRLIAVGSSRIFFRGEVTGAERLPASGAYVLAPVHRSNVDWLVVARVTRRRLRYLVKGEVWKVRSVGRLLELLGAFPVRRGAPDRESFETALSVLAGGEPLVVFPEGTRGSGPVIGELRDGAAYLALRAGVPIVPVGLGGTEAAMPRGRRLPRPARVRLVIGQPIEPGTFLEGRPGRPSGAAPRRVPRSATQRLSVALHDGLQVAFDEAEGRAGAEAALGAGSAE